MANDTQWYVAVNGQQEGPMSAEEAVERMELLGHGFFFFTHEVTSRAAVVYRRDDGHVGLIDEAD